jgi:Domain of unknown function (DUF4395)
MSQVFEFGEQKEGYSVRVLNERAVRAAAGIMFLFGFMSFMNAWLIGNFQPTRLFVVVFLIDFAIRIFINPRFAPSLIVGQWFVRKQQPEWSGAPQKRFAWAIGFVLALVMFYTMVINNVVGPINLLTCATCLTLMLFETSFGICIGCKLYNALNKNQAQLCPGGVCELPPERNSGVSKVQLAVVALFAATITGIAPLVYGQKAKADAVAVTAPAKIEPVSTPVTTIKTAAELAEIERCTVPGFAKMLGHEDKWKLHNNCK